jgi:RNAse (barnase) inhibitor barstar
MYQYKELYTIDFSKVQHYLEMHFIIRQALDWPDYYGCNWSAFWDC